MGLGTFIGCFAALYYDRFAPMLTAKYPTKKPECLRLPVACAGGPPFVISLLWLGWAASSGMHWSVPWLALLPYGFAYQLIFVAMINVLSLIPVKIGPNRLTELVCRRRLRDLLGFGTGSVQHDSKYCRCPNSSCYRQDAREFGNRLVMYRVGPHHRRLGNRSFLVHRQRRKDTGGESL